MSAGYIKIQIRLLRLIPILELKSLFKVKPKEGPSDAKNKKQSGAQARLDESTRREPSRFEHEEAQKTHCTRVIGENSSTVAVSKKKRKSKTDENLWTKGSSYLKVVSSIIIKLKKTRQWLKNLGQ